MRARPSPSGAPEAGPRRAATGPSRSGPSLSEDQPLLTRALPTGTFVALPLSQAWRQARTTQEFLGYQWERLLTKLVDLGGILAIKYLSMPSLTSLPRFKVQRSSIAPTATALHRRMSEAVAAGDGAALRQICVPALYNQLTAAIRRRTPDERVEWELVEYVRPLSFPRIASNRCINLSSDEYYQQAVVGIAATQRLARYARATGEVVAGSTRLRTAVEYLVISRKINAKTWEPTPWRIWGTREETTSESWANEKRYLSTMKAKAAAR